VADARKWVLPFTSALFLALAIGAVCGYALERFKFWPRPLVDSVTEAAVSIAKFGAVIPRGRRMVAPPQAARERFKVHDPARMHGGFYAFAGWDDEHRRYGAWLLDAAGKVLHTWSLAYAAIDPEGVGEDDSPHGFVVLRDGSVIANFDGGRAMARFDACGTPVWKKEGVYHHQVSAAEDGSFWVWRGDGTTAYGNFQYIEHFDGATGAKIEEIGLIEDILKKDPNAPLVLGLRPDLAFRKLSQESTTRSDEDLFHPNDVEPLGAALAPRFPMFAPGDLLVSIRRVNLVAVLDGTTHRFKWWSHGPWLSQHDPDFTEDGAISVYDNNTTRRRSEIVRIDPATQVAEELPVAPGAEFYSAFMGQHQHLPNGNVLIVSPGEGRALERSPEGGLVMEFNNLPAAGSRFNDHVENGAWLPGDYFETLPSCRGESP
jgi:hypothetical protein